MKTLLDPACYQRMLARFRGSEMLLTLPTHPFFGRMTRASWGRFCHRHFAHRPELLS